MTHFAACACYLLLRFIVYGARYMYVVVAVDIITAFQVQHNFVELSYLYFELGSFIAIIFTSPISDFSNRRAIIVVYFALAIIGSFLISYIHSEWVFYGARFIEGLGLGNLFSIGNAIIFDAYKINDEKNSIIMSRVLSRLGIFSSFFIVLNLFVFALLSHYFDWHELFFILSVLIAITGTLTFLLLTFFHEPKKTEKKITVTMVCKEYWQIISRLKTLCYVLVFSLSKTANTLLYILLTFMLIRAGYNAVNATLCLSPLALANLIGKQLNVAFINHLKIKPRYILFFSALIQFLPMAFVLVITLINAKLLSYLLLICVCALMTIGTGLLSPLSNSRLMALFPDKPNMANNMLTIFTGLWINLFIFLADLVNAAHPVPFIMLIFGLTGIILIIVITFLIFHRHFDSHYSAAHSPGKPISTISK